VVNKTQRYGYLLTPFKIQTMDELRQGLDKTVFHSSRYNPHHVLYRLLPRPKDTVHKLRQRAHNLTLPSDVGSTARQNFIPRMLFTDMYWSFFYLSNDNVYVLYISCIFSFLLCCNASAFVVCAIKNYLLTYLMLQIIRLNSQPATVVVLLC